MNGVRNAAIIGWGAALPENIVTNADLEKTLDTNDAWITERTGIRERRVGSTTSALALEAAQAALIQAECDVSSLDAIVVATITPDQAFPGVATQLAETLGFTGATFDLNAACAGFVYGLDVGAGLIATTANRVLLVGAETMSRTVDPTDRATAVLFGDGAGAVVLQATANDVGLQSFHAGTDGGARSLLYAEHGKPLVMDGREVFRRAIRATVTSAQAAIERAKIDVSDIALFIPHQANLRIIEGITGRLGIPDEHTVVIVDKTGNTSAASIPLALATAANDGRLHDGDLVLMSGFGAGMSWASVIWRWGS